METRRQADHKGSRNKVHTIRHTAFCNSLGDRGTDAETSLPRSSPENAVTCRGFPGYGAHVDRRRNTLGWRSADRSAVDMASRADGRNLELETRTRLHFPSLQQNLRSPIRCGPSKKRRSS